ncbi:hypothetical protein AX16_002479 [Volvariella volvacea WC 439]|nr:hypothetical protein AX16_002479 [Volvariella volvacea WC 439]
MQGGLTSVLSLLAIIPAISAVVISSTVEPVHATAIESSFVPIGTDVPVSSVIGHPGGTDGATTIVVPTVPGGTSGPIPTVSVNGTSGPISSTIAPTVPVGTAYPSSHITNGTTYPTLSINGTAYPTHPINGTAYPTHPINGTAYPTHPVNGTAYPTHPINGTATVSFTTYIPGGTPTGVIISSFVQPTTVYFPHPISSSLGNPVTVYPTSSLGQIITVTAPGGTHVPSFPSSVVATPVVPTPANPNPAKIALKFGDQWVTYQLEPIPTPLPTAA